MQTITGSTLSQRLVPFGLVDGDNGRFTTACTADQIKHAPKVAPHVQPSHQELEELCAHYGVPVPA